MHFISFETFFFIFPFWIERRFFLLCWSVFRIFTIKIYSFSSRLSLVARSIWWCSQFIRYEKWQSALERVVREEKIWISMLVCPRPNFIFSLHSDLCWINIPFSAFFIVFFTFAVQWPYVNGEKLKLLFHQTDDDDNCLWWLLKIHIN